MKRMRAGWWAAVVVLMLAAPAGAAWAQTQPPTEPIPRIETGMHNAQIWRIGIDASCRVMLTGSDDNKTARLWALPEQGAGAPKPSRHLPRCSDSDAIGGVSGLELDIVNRVLLTHNGRIAICSPQVRNEHQHLDETVL
jgi:hypothetical protein